MAVAVVIEHHVDLVTGPPARPAQTGQHRRRQLPAPHIGDHLRAVEAVKPGTPVGTDGQPDPGPPAQRVAGSDRLGRTLPMVITKPRKLIRDNAAFEHPHRRRVGEGQVATTRTVGTGDRTQ